MTYALSKTLLRQPAGVGVIRMSLRTMNVGCTHCTSSPLLLVQQGRSMIYKAGHETNVEFAHEAATQNSRPKARRRRHRRRVCHAVLADAEEVAHQGDGMKAMFGKNRVVRRRVGDDPLVAYLVELGQRCQVPHHLPVFGGHNPAVHLVRQWMTLQPAS